MYMPIKTHDLISDLDPKTNNFVQFIQNPKNGDVFFHYSTDKKKLDDWKSDGMNWCNNGQKTINKQNNKPLYRIIQHLRTAKQEYNANNFINHKFEIINFI